MLRNLPKNRALASLPLRRVSTLSAPARKAAEELSRDWKGTSATGANTKLYIGGEFVESKAEKWIDVHDPVCSLFLFLRVQRFNWVLVDTNRINASTGDHGR
jgi:malonate-semialdehyde dehydrogenase (acetylating)/methylmalonate-semialdehyde dehydrogenase